MSSDQLEIVLVAAVAALAVGVLGLASGYLLRHRSIRWQLGLVAVVAVLSVLAGVLAIAQRMVISASDLEVVTLVTVVSAVISLAVAVVVGAALARWSQGLQAEVRRVGTDPGLVARKRGPSEFQALSSELAAAHLRLAESRAREQRLEEARRELISWVSHDLRTPLAGMRAMTEALEDGMAPEPERYHRQIRSEVDRMVLMVDDLFELSRIHAGVLQLSPELLALGDLVSEAIAGAEPVARARGVALGGSVEPGLQVVADPGGLSRVLSNLVMNALRHTPAGGEVDIRGRRLPDGIELTVTDGCGGIDADDLARVFDVAWKGTSARTPDADIAAHTGQAGLGLAIVKGIVEAHGGEVSVDNASRRDSTGDSTGDGTGDGTGDESVSGCTFVVRLPHGLA